MWEERTWGTTLKVPEPSLLHLSLLVVITFTSLVKLNTEWDTGFTWAWLLNLILEPYVTKNVLPSFSLYPQRHMGRKISMETHLCRFLWAYGDGFRKSVSGLIMSMKKSLDMKEYTYEKAKVEKTISLQYKMKNYVFWNGGTRRGMEKLGESCLAGIKSLPHQVFISVWSTLNVFQE